MKNEVSAYSFLHVLNDLHPLISFTVELSTENTLPFSGMVFVESKCKTFSSLFSAFSIFVQSRVFVFRVVF